jgi:hypothetical protein
MASEKNPSIYYDRSTIGSSEELDEYGVWVKSEPQDLSSVNADNRDIPLPEEDFSELAGDMPDFGETEPIEVSPDMEDLADFNINSEDGAFGSEVSAGEDDLTLFSNDEDFSFDDIPEEFAISEAGSEEVVSAVEDNALGDDLIYQKGNASGDDLIYQKGTLDKLLQKAEAEQKALAPQNSSETGDSKELSTQLLMQIAGELSSIKNELSSLKKELHQVRREDEIPAAKGGFFDEEDDEKIALTGDELNNILNTADFTEETGADATGGETPDAGPSLVIPDEEDAGDSFSEIDTIDLSGTGTVGENLPEFDDTVDIPFGEDKIFPELEQLREDGVEPMTPAPEDTSYLTEVPAISDLPEDISFESSLDFDNAVIEEPDLSAELKENPIAEPSLENISLELDMEDTAGEDEAGDILSNDDLNLSFGDSENIELSLDGFDSSDELISEDLSLDNISLGTSDISIDDAADEPAAGENPDGDMYDQVIPEGFLVEPEDGQTPEEILGNDEILENAEEFTLDDALDIEGIPADASIQLDSVAEEASTSASMDAAVEEDTAGISLPAETGTEKPKETPQVPAGASPAIDASAIPPGIKNEIRSVLSYMDQLLESLPENKIEEFAKSEHFATYKKLFEEFDLV